jgi:hypothetical protein
MDFCDDNSGDFIGIEIESDYSSLMMKAISYVHEGKKITVDKNERMPPLIKLEMMVSLYFPEFREEWESLESAKNSFGEELANLILISTENLQLSERQKLAGKFAVLRQIVDKRVIEFKQTIVRTIQA